MGCSVCVSAHLQDSAYTIHFLLVQSPKSARVERLRLSQAFWGDEHSSAPVCGLLNPQKYV